jgi:glucokinase
VRADKNSGGVVLGGELVRGAFGAAAEVGHMNLVPDGRPCGCGPLGCWEQDASGRALVTEARQRAARSPEQARLLLELAGGRPESITGPMVTMDAIAGDRPWPPSRPSAPGSARPGRPGPR